MRKHNAFTMIELIIIIVVIGILATYTVPRMHRNNRLEAMQYILNMVRYTQNLALHDNKQNDTNTSWQKAYWRFSVNRCSGSSDIYLYIGSDANYNGSIDVNEVALDPANSKPMFGGGTLNCSASSNDAKDYSPNSLIKSKFGITNFKFAGCGFGTTQYLGFDNFGRVYRKFGSSTRPDYSSYSSSKDCTIEFEFGNSNESNFTIHVVPETGYAYVAEKPNL